MVQLTVEYRKPSLSTPLGITVVEGKTAVFVSLIEHGSLVEQCGLRVSDTLLKVNGETAQHPTQCTELLKGAIESTVLVERIELTNAARLSVRSHHIVRMFKEEKGDALGVTVSQDASHTSRHEDGEHPITVVIVQRGSIAEECDLRVGDVMLSVNAERCQTPSQCTD